MKPEIPLAKLQQDTQTALEAWFQPDPETGPFDWLQIFQQIRLQGGGTTREATNQLLLNALEILATKRADEAELLRRYFLEGEKMQAIAGSYHLSQAELRQKKDGALHRLALILQAREVQARAEKQATLIERLEISTAPALIGVEEHLERLLGLIASPEPPWLISVEGVGGLGKTALADALSRQAITRPLCDDFGWVSARREALNLGGGREPVNSPALSTENLVDRLLAQLLPDSAGRLEFSIQEATAALTWKLKQGRHLLVIDNLETAIDLETLWPLLQALSNPAKILLTSRESLPAGPAVYHFSLPELSQADTLRLIRREARLRNLPHLRRANDNDLNRIFESVGGNPLAIRLVLGQVQAYALADILKDLAAARGQTVEALYEHLYGRSWLALDEIARQVLLAMPLVAGQKGTPAYLSRLSGLEAAGLQAALDWLAALNLVDCQGSLADRHYTIHNLTRTFLQEQVLKW